jgi:hypothetical protein
MILGGRPRLMLNLKLLLVSLTTNESDELQECHMLSLSELQKILSKETTLNLIFVPFFDISYFVATAGNCIIW